MIGADGATTSAYDAAVAVTAGRGGSYHGEVAAGWEVGDVPNGGYLIGIAVEAVLAELQLPDPLSTTTHFLRPAEPGPVTLAVERVRRGRRHGTATVTMRQHDRDVLRVLATAADLAVADGPSLNLRHPPRLPEITTCPTLEEAGPFIERPISRHLEMRFDPDHLGFLDGRPSGDGVIAGWARFADGRGPDVRCCAVFADAFPPSSTNLELDVERAPTLEMTVHARARPSPGWLRQVVRTEVVTDGYIIEDGELWDATGVLVAQSRQLALAPRRRS